MSKILLSIKPKYAHKIFNGIKKFEYRKYLPQRHVSKIVIYSTAPEGLVLGEVEVKGILEMKKTPLWEHTKEFSGITRDNFRSYFKNCTKAYAYVLGKVTLYEKPLKLENMGVNKAPQAFVYLTKK